MEIKHILRRIIGGSLIFASPQNKEKKYIKCKFLLLRKRPLKISLQVQPKTTCTPIVAFFYTQVSLKNTKVQSLSKVNPS
jgi:hypothetical protein